MALHPLIVPSFTRAHLVRIVAVAALAFLFFRYLCIPLHISGDSMHPAYRDGGFTFCWRLRYIRRPAQRHDPVVVRFAGTRVMLLKRVVALQGETVEFRHGRLHIDGAPVEEPYINGPCGWTLPPRLVKPGHVYVVGDNRAIPAEQHVFGQTPWERVMGGPLW